MTLGSMASNRYSAPFREDVNGWITKLSTVSEIVEQWLMVQSMWMYMEAVFSGGDIVKQLPQEAKRFQNIDKSFMKVRSRAHGQAGFIAYSILWQVPLHVNLYRQIRNAADP